MSAIMPLHLSKWVNYITTIDAPQVREEFLNIYNLVNGGIDSENLADTAIKTNKIADEAVTDSKIKSVSSSKVKGKISVSNLPDGLAMTTGGDITGTFTFNTTNPFIKTYSQKESIILEAGVGENKITWAVNPTGDALVIKRGNVVLLTLAQDGTLITNKLRIPGE